MTRDLLTLLKHLYAEFDCHYDGAEDSSTRWMGEYLEELRAAIKKLEGV